MFGIDACFKDIVENFPVPELVSSSELPIALSVVDQLVDKLATNIIEGFNEKRFIEAFNPKRFNESRMASLESLSLTDWCYYTVQRNRRGRFKMISDAAQNSEVTSVVSAMIEKLPKVMEKKILDTEYFTFRLLWKGPNYPNPYTQFYEDSKERVLLLSIQDIKKALEH